MVAKSPPKQKRACPAPLNPNLLRETVKKVDQCMARLQELQYTVSGGAKEVSGTTLSPRSTRGYLRTSIRCKQESLRCSLGDVTNNEAYYEKALEVSNNKSARAKNSLYTDGWFALGAAALKARDIDEALYAFTCSVKLDPDNGEAWNNIACLGKGDNIWGLYGRWHRMKGDLTMCSEALLKQVRSYQGADLWNNKDRFKKFLRLLVAVEN